MGTKETKRIILKLLQCRFEDTPLDTPLRRHSFDRPLQLELKGNS